MVFIVVKCLDETSSIESGDPFSFPVPDRDKGTGVERIPDQLVNLFGVVSLVHDVEVRMSGSVTLYEEFFGVRDIVNRMLGDLQAGDDLLISINSDRGFQEPFSRLTGPPGIVVAGIRAGEPG